MSTIISPRRTRSKGGGYYRLTVADYHEMIEKGILKSGDKIELLEGMLVRMMTVYPPHTATLRKLNKKLFRALQEPWNHQQQGAITLSASQSEPEPDTTVFRGSDDDFIDRNPTAVEIGLVIEVSESTLRRDRGRKQRIYARERIVEYWIINLIDEHIEVYTDPSGPGDKPAYANRKDYLRGTSVPLVLDGVTIAEFAVNDLLP